MVLEQFIAIHSVMKWPVLWNLKLQHRAEDPAIRSYQSQLDAFITLKPCLSKIKFNIILSSNPVFPKWCLPSRIYD
jgi:hypothetical protein